MSDSTLDLGVRMPPCRPVAELADFSREVEAAGFDTLYVPDSQTFWRDPYLTLFAAAERTSRLRLTTAVSNVVTRHPTVIAGLARSMDEAAPGRFTLGLGVGHSSVEPIGMRPSTGTAMRTAVDEIRRLVRGEEVAYGAGVSCLRDPRPNGVPIHLAATGPRNLRLAGEIADGVILLSGVAAAPLTRAIETVRAGAEAAGRCVDEIQVTVAAHAMITDDLERDARILKPIATTIAQRGGAAALSAAGIELHVPSHVPEVTPDLIHAEDWSHAVDVCSRWVSDADAVAFARTFCLFGTPEEIVARIEETRRLGVTGIFFQHVGSWDLPTRLIETLGEQVLPRLRG